MSAQTHIGVWRCPGVFRDIHVQPCPKCDEEVEFFPQDLSLDCSSCGTKIKRTSSSCLLHCPAKQSSCYRDMVRADLLHDDDQDPQ